MKVALTGAGGFIGRETYAQLRDADIFVRAWLGPDDVAPEDADAAQGDICDARLASNVIKDTNALVHLAGPASVADSFNDPGMFARVHTVGTVTVVSAAIAAGVQKIVLISSAEVYGSSSGDPVDEDAQLAPRSPYGAAKLGAELLARAISAGAAVDLTILRPFSVYGIGLRRGSVVDLICRQALWEDSVRLQSLTPVRDYVHVSDVARAIVAAVRRPVSTGTKVYNIASGEGVSVSDLAAKVLSLAQRQIPVLETAGDAKRRMDISALVGDASAAASALAWRPQVSLENGLSILLSAIKQDTT